MIPSKVRKWDYSPSIDRLFRFIEMVGVTALLIAVLKPSLTEVGTMALATCLTSLSLIYLIEPFGDWLLTVFTGNSVGWAAVFNGLCFLATILGGLLVLGPLVIRLAFMVSMVVAK